MEYTHTAAIISLCNKYRYTLERKWEDGDGDCTFIMLNPSTADVRKDDPTIRKCVGFAHKLGCSSLTVVNVYAYRATKPKDLEAAGYPMGPENLTYITRNIQWSKFIIAAWGNNVPKLPEELFMLLRDYNLHCLGKTKLGNPKHPLLLPYETELEPYELINEETKETKFSG